MVALLSQFMDFDFCISLWNTSCIARGCIQLCFQGVSGHVPLDFHDPFFRIPVLSTTLYE